MSLACLWLHSQKRQTTCENNLMPPAPWQLEKLNSDKYLTRWFCSKNDGFLIHIFLDNQFELFNNNTTGKIILYLVKNLDLVVIHVTHNYPSITKICCRRWKPELSFLTTFRSKLCHKLSIRFKYLNSVIHCITDH